MFVYYEELGASPGKGVGDAFHNPVLHSGILGVVLASGVILLDDELLGIVALHQKVMLPSVRGDFAQHLRGKELLKENSVGLSGHDPGAVEADYVLVVSEGDYSSGYFPHAESGAARAEDHGDPAAVEVLEGAAVGLGEGSVRGEDGVVDVGCKEAIHGDTLRHCAEGGKRPSLLPGTELGPGRTWSSRAAAAGYVIPLDLSGSLWHFHSMTATGKLEKMSVKHADPVRYTLQLGEDAVEMNELIGREISINFTGEIRCILCDRVTPKAYGQGFCYPCFRDAPENSECIVRPELCRGHLGEGRDPEWEEEHHNKPHAVYLALSSAVKVGVTRWTQIPTRWIDQGAAQAIVVARTPYRQLAGAIEIASKELYTDRTNWQRMLKDERLEAADLLAERERLLSTLPGELAEYGVRDSGPLAIDYPLEVAPEKVRSVNLDKQPILTGRLSGIRGQYLVLDEGVVINIRRFSGYIVQLSA